MRGPTPLIWSHSEEVITLPCHGSITGSNPVGTVLRLLVQLDKTLDFYSSITDSSPVQPAEIYIVRLEVRTQLFHGWNTGSNPVRCIVIIYEPLLLSKTLTV